MRAGRRRPRPPTRGAASRAQREQADETAEARVLDEDNADGRRIGDVRREPGDGEEEEEGGEDEEDEDLVPDTLDQGRHHGAPETRREVPMIRDGTIARLKRVERYP